MSRPAAFSKKAFLNPYYMRYLNPSDCEEIVVKNPKMSVIDTIDALECSPNIGSTKGKVHTALKPVRMLARTVYAVFVSAIIAPIGALYHGTLLLT